MQTGLCRSEPSLWPGPSPRTGKRISDARDEGPQSASGTVFVSRKDRERAITPAPNREKSRVFRGDGELGVSAVEPATRQQHAAAGKFRIWRAWNAASTMAAERTGVRLRIERWCRLS